MLYIWDCHKRHLFRNELGEQVQRINSDTRSAFKLPRTYRMRNVNKLCNECVHEALFYSTINPIRSFCYSTSQCTSLNIQYFHTYSIYTVKKMRNTASWCDSQRQAFTLIMSIGTVFICTENCMRCYLLLNSGCDTFIRIFALFM